jgi:purine-nucleoside phosphorylase
LLPGTAGFGRIRGDDPTDGDRHPGVGSSVGKAHRASAASPSDAILEAHMSSPHPTEPGSPGPGSVTNPIDPSRSIPPAEQPPRLAALEAAVRARTDLVPEVGIVLGSGLGGLADDVEDPVAIPFGDLPGWPAATAPGHVGRLLLGRLAGRAVIMLQGRFHIYEGNDPGLVVQPVLLFRRLGARAVVLTNAAGGIDPAFGPGTLMVIRDHLNLTGRTPLLGQNADGLGDRFQDLTDAWAPRLREGLLSAGRSEGVELAEGVYAGLLGPQYETPAEVRMLRTLGADAVGMSTVLECIAARWVGLEVCGVSLVTNAGAGYTGEPLTHEEVLASGAEAGPRLARVIRRFIADFPG